MMKPWMVSIALVLLLTAIVAAPLLGPSGLPIYAAFSWFCHQRPERSWHLAGYPMAVCVRCFGLYTGALTGWAAGHKFSRLLFFAASGFLAADWLLETIGWLSPHPLSRYVIGFLMGFFLIPALRLEHFLTRSRSKLVRSEIRA